MKMLEFIQQKDPTPNGTIARAAIKLLTDKGTDQFEDPEQAIFFVSMFTTLDYVRQFGLPDDLTDYLNDVPDVADFPHWSNNSC